MQKPLFSPSELPCEPRARWFLKRGQETLLESGFASKASAAQWIDNLGRRLDWRAGFVFQLRGDSTPMSIVDRNGKKAVI